MFSENFGILITAYRQLDMVRQNILRIRNQYNILNTCPICIVTTAEEDIGFTNLYLEFDDVYIIQFPDAPGSPLNSWFSPRDNSKAGGYVSWRHKFLPARILLSMQKGIELLYDINVNKILHIHSDTFWRPEFECNLIKDIETLNNYMAMVDLSYDDEVAAQTHTVVQPGIHWHPEGLLLNLDKCHEVGYGFTFNKIFDPNSGYESHNYGSIESNLGQYAIWCLTKKNITKYTDAIPGEYFTNIYVRSSRTYHCDTNYGLVNLPGTQPDSQ